MSPTGSIDIGTSTLLGDHGYRVVVAYVSAASGSTNPTLTTELLGTGPAPVWQVEPIPYAPRWLDTMLVQVNRLAYLRPDWDSFAGRRLLQRAAIRGMSLLSECGFEGPTPWVSPTPDGGLHMEWAAPGLGGVEIEVEPSSQVFVMCAGANGDVDEWEVADSEDHRLLELLGAIGDHPEQ